MPPNRFVIRWFGPADRPAIKMIERLSFDNALTPEWFSDDSPWQCHVAETPEFGVVGFCIWDTKGARIRVVRMGVHPEFRRSGYGRGIMEALKRNAGNREHGIQVDIDGANLGGALFLKAMGFTGKTFGEDQYRFKLTREKVKNA